MPARLPALFFAALICALAGAAVGNAYAQSEQAGQSPPRAERPENPGLAPPTPCLGGRIGACCDLPDLAYHTRCQEWLPKYKRWRKAFDAYHQNR